jgi:hypothetical protein
VRDWLYPRYTPRPGSRPRTRTVDLVALPKPAYSYLLGFYLGDGTISRHRKCVYRLRIVCDSRYPNIIEECAAAMAGVMAQNPARRSCGRSAWDFIDVEWRQTSWKEISVARRGSVALLDSLIGPKS